ncbi:MAG: nucleoside deaminase [Alphaproteobacteria bacterium]|nr:nucleoside deaminase [Alphaproteobacteria bacterium]
MSDLEYASATLEEWLRNGDMHTQRMQRVYTLAKEAKEYGEVPVAASLWHQDTLVVEHANRVERDNNPLAHAELLCAQKAHNMERRYWSECTLYVTLQPCTMCSAVLQRMRLHTLCFGAFDKEVPVGKPPYPTLILGGVLEEPCAALLQEFFSGLR